MIKVENLSFRYTDSRDLVLDDISLEIQDGEFVLVTGPSGSGKSSLGRCFNGLIPHFYGGEIAGKVEVQDLDIMLCSTKEIAARVGMIFQDPENQIIATDVEREMAFGLENLAFPRNLIARRIEESLDALGIFNLRHKQTRELSGGEKQKVAIASILALHPEVLVLDEPTSELDPQSAEDLLSTIEKLNDELGITIILIEHRLERVLPYVDRLIVLDRGRKLIDGDVQEVLRSGYQKVSDTGIGLPPLIRLTQKLRQHNAGPGDIPLTVKEGRVLLQGMLQSTRGKKLSQEQNCKEEPARDFNAQLKANGRKKPAAIRVEKLGYSYPEGIKVLQGINLEVREGEFVAIMGRNTAGKSTLVKHFNGLLKPTIGTVTVYEKDTRRTTTAELSRKVGFVSQNPNDHLFADMVEDEINFALKNLGYSQVDIRLRTEDVLDRFGLREYRRQYPRSLSGGERQRVALASVVAVRPKILILDEPTRGMEYRLKTELMSFLRDYVRLGNTVILITHDVEIVADYAERVILMSEGKIRVDGGKHEVLSRALLFSPQINRLVQPFEKYGIPGDTLNVDELLRVIN